jgi:uncharacterized membrane protein
MASDKFRRQLRQEAEQWRRDGVIDGAQWQQLAERYQFDKLDLAARDRFIIVVIGLGSVLLGLSVITFVAANWQEIPRGFKLLMLMTLFIGVNAAGFYLWQQPRLMGDRWQHRLGQGLLLLGALILGANMALLGQMFHIGGSTTDLCIIWGLAVLGMAYGLRLTSMGMLAILLTGMGYWIGTSGWWDHPTSGNVRAVMDQMPLVAGLAFVPLAYWFRSRWLFGMGAIAVISSLYVVTSKFAEIFSTFYNALGIWLALCFLLPSALLWSYDDRIWQRFSPRFEVDPIFRDIAKGLALLCLTGLTYGLSYHYAWEGSRAVDQVADARLWNESLSLLLNPSLLFFIGLTVAQWFYLARPRRTGWGLSQTDGMMLVFLGVIATITFWHWSISPISEIATFLSNVLLFLLAIAFMRDGLAAGERRLFWSGLTLVALQILSRLLEYDTALLLKSLAFLLCGIGVIGVGLWFERYVRTFRADSRTASEDES